jgi:hypothetical protein
MALHLDIELCTMKDYYRTIITITLSPEDLMKKVILALVLLCFSFLAVPKVSALSPSSETMALFSLHCRFTDTDLSNYEYIYDKQSEDFSQYGPRKKGMVAEYGVVRIFLSNFYKVSDYSVVDAINEIRQLCSEELGDEMSDILSKVLTNKSKYYHGDTLIPSALPFSEELIKSLEKYNSSITNCSTRDYFVVDEGSWVLRANPKSDTHLDYCVRVDTGMMIEYEFSWWKYVLHRFTSGLSFFVFWR